MRVLITGYRTLQTLMQAKKELVLNDDSHEFECTEYYSISVNG